MRVGEAARIARFIEQIRRLGNIFRVGGVSKFRGLLCR
jgi:hypothetical protein